MAESYRPALQDVAQRALNRETNDVKQAARRFLKAGDADGYHRWLDEFYHEHTDFIRRYIDKPLQTYAGLVAIHIEEEIGQAVSSDLLGRQMASYIDNRATDWAAGHRAELQGLVAATRAISDGAAADVLAATEDRLGHWQETEAEDWSREQVNRAGNYAALALYAAAHILRKRWRAFGDNCPYCSQMNGRIVELKNDFLAAGAEMAPTGANPFRPSRSIGHPPLHAGCDCLIVADVDSLAALGALAEAAT